MTNIKLIATAKSGLEQIVKDELIALGFDILSVSNGKIEFEASLEDIPRANLWLRCADRVLLKMGEFKAYTFDELFEQTKALPWEKFITEDGEFTVNAKSVRSTLRSARTCQSIVKKAVVNRLKEKYDTDWFEETGPKFTIQVYLNNDVATLGIDTSGVGLHKRGYREEAGEAPLKETLAAALVILSSWNKDEILIDPMCGSGTILIEAVMIARNMAPGLNRNFASEEWPAVGENAWDEARRIALASVNSSHKLQIWGYDVDEAAIRACKRNARNAGIQDDITFAQKDIRNLWIDRQFGVIISNPPYGIRMSDFKIMNELYVAINKTFRKKSGWSLFILTADKKFPRYFKRAQPNHVSSLYNGNIEVNYYHYLGDRPPAKT